MNQIKYAVVGYRNSLTSFGIAKKEVLFRSLLDGTPFALLLEGVAAEYLKRVKIGGVVSLYFNEQKTVKKMIVL